MYFHKMCLNIQHGDIYMFIANCKTVRKIILIE